ncbi:MAG: DUF4230 domain-containing protein [Treponema sp.]|nr:DUF4230 domain-containing protein [Treponema sp.]
MITALSKLFNKILLKIIIISALLAALFFGSRFGWQKLGEVKTEKSSALVFRELERCSQLVTAKNTYSDIISIKKTRIAGFAKTFSIIKYTGTIKAGISDITKSKISVYNRGKAVKITLPKVEILSNDISNIEIFDEGKSIFVAISIKEIFEEIHFNQETASAEILETGFLEEAEAQAVKIIEAMLYAAGFDQIDIEFDAL